MFRADLTIKEVQPPVPRFCNGADGGHDVPDGAVFQGKPTRFFRVTGKGVQGTFCEPCLVLANAMAREKKRRAAR